MFYYNSFKDNKTRKLYCLFLVKLTAQHIDFGGLKQLITFRLFSYCAIVSKGFGGDLSGFFEQIFGFNMLPVE